MKSKIIHRFMSPFGTALYESLNEGNWVVQSQPVRRLVMDNTSGKPECNGYTLNIKSDNTLYYYEYTKDPYSAYHKIWHDHPDMELDVSLWAEPLYNMLNLFEFFIIVSKVRGLFRQTEKAKTRLAKKGKQTWRNNSVNRFVERIARGKS